MPEVPGHPAAMGRRGAVLKVLKDSRRPLSISDIADVLSVHPNTVRFHLETLVEHGQAEQVPPAGTGGEPRPTGRPPWLFRSVPGMDPTAPRQYGVLADVLVQSLATDQEGSARAVEAGRAWGRRQGATTDASDADVGAGSGTDRSVTALMGLLDEIGFAPELREDPDRSRPGDQPQIGLRNCPFLALVDTASGVVCRVHLGMMQGVLEGWRSPLTVDRLDAFAEPDLCLAHLSRAHLSRAHLSRAHLSRGGAA